MKRNVSEERLRELLQDPSTPEEVKDLASDALMAVHLESGNKSIIKDLRDTIQQMEERRPFILNRPRTPLKERQDLRESWDKASPAPWGCWAQQPEVTVFHSGDPSKMVANIDTWTGRGVFDAEAMTLSRRLVIPLLEELETFEEQEKTRWRMLAKTSPSGKRLFVCLSCGVVSISPNKNACKEPVTIASGGSIPSEVLDCETAYQRRPR